MTDHTLLKATGSTTKKATKQVARIVQDESLELFKSAKKQIAGEFFEPAQQEAPRQEEAKFTDQEKQTKAINSTRRLEELEAEIQKLRKEREAQKQEEAQKDKQAELAQTQQVDPLIEPSAKRKRGLFGGAGKRLTAGMGSQLEKLKRKSEIRMPPSG